MKKYLKIMLAILLFPNIVLAFNIQLQECEYTKEYKEWLRLPEDIRKTKIQPQKCAYSNIATPVGEGETTYPAVFSLGCY